MLSTKLSSNEKTKNGHDEWNDAWETAWLPDDLSAKNRAPWETDVNFPSTDSNLVFPSDYEDSETKAFVEDMTENWNERRGKVGKTQVENLDKKNNSLYSVENMKKDYRLRKQRIHAGLWMKEIEKQEEAKLGDSIVGGGDNIERLLDSCSEYDFSISFYFFNSFVFVFLF